MAVIDTSLTWWRQLHAAAVETGCAYPHELAGHLVRLPVNTQRDPKAPVAEAVEACGACLGCTAEPPPGTDLDSWPANVAPIVSTSL